MKKKALGIIFRYLEDFYSHYVPKLNWIEMKSESMDGWKGVVAYDGRGKKERKKNRHMCILMCISSCASYCCLMRTVNESNSRADIGKKCSFMSTIEWTWYSNLFLVIFLIIEHALTFSLLDFLVLLLFPLKLALFFFPSSFKVINHNYSSALFLIIPPPLYSFRLAHSYLIWWMAKSSLSLSLFLYEEIKFHG